MTWKQKGKYTPMSSTIHCHDKGAVNSKVKESKSTTVRVIQRVSKKPVSFRRRLSKHVGLTNKVN